MAKPPPAKPVTCPYCGKSFVPDVSSGAPGTLDFSNPANSGLLILLEDI